MNLSRDALVQLERNMRTTLDDNHRTRQQCALALSELVKAFDAYDRKAIERLTREREQIRREVAARFAALDQASVWARLRWLLRGTR